MPPTFMMRLLKQMLLMILANMLPFQQKSRTNVHGKAEKDGPNAENFLILQDELVKNNE